MENWSEARPGVHIKLLGREEKAFKDFVNPVLYGGREHYVLLVTAYLETELMSLDDSDKAHLRLSDAWKATRFDHPALAMKADAESLVYTCPDPAEIASWLCDTYSVKTDVSPDDLPSTLGESVMPHLYYFPKQCAVSIRASHWRFDFEGLLMMMNRLLQHFVDGSKIDQWGAEVERLRPAFAEAVGLPEEPTQEAQTYLDDMFSRSYASGLTSGIPLKSGNEMVPPRETKQLRAVLTRESTSSLLSACKNAGYTVTIAVHAASIVATMALAPRDLDQLPQSIVLPRDLRRMVEKRFSGEDFAVNCCTTAQILTVYTKDQTFHDIATSLKVQYTETYSAAKQVAASREFGRRVVPWYMRPSPPNLPRMSAPLLSSIGLLNQYLKPEYRSTSSRTEVKVKDITLQADTPVPQLTAWLYTWDGKLRLAPSYNDSYFSDETMARYVNLVFKTLSTEMGLKLETES